MHKGLVALAVVSTACASAQVTPELRRSAALVKLVDGAPPPEFKPFGEVQALSCARKRGASPDTAAAKEQLKIEAARVNANAVTSILCAEEGASFSDNCWKAIRCKGDAGRLP